VKQPVKGKGKKARKGFELSERRLQSPLKKERLMEKRGRGDPGFTRGLEKVWEKKQIR